MHHRLKWSVVDYMFILCFPVNSPQVNVQGVATVSGTGAITKVEVTLKCRAHGQPSPDIKWINGSGDLTNQARLLTQADGFTNSSITFQVPLSKFISQLNYHKQGQSSRVVRCSWRSYRCIASYPAGDGEARSSTHALLRIDLSMNKIFKFITFPTFFAACSTLNSNKINSLFWTKVR